MQKKSIPLLITTITFLFISFSQIHAWRYEGQRYNYFYTIDLPKSWELVDDAKKYNAFFQNRSKDAFAEVTVHDLKSAKNIQELYQSFIDRYKMTGNYYSTTFCQYDALRGEYDFYFDNADLKMDFVVFKDKYYFYIIMGYCYSNKYEQYKELLKEVIDSCKIYYDDKVVYGNEKTKNETKVSSNNNNKKMDTQTKTKNEGAYKIRISWENNERAFEFLKEDLDKAKKELADIGEYSDGYWNGWQYFNIDTINNPDYEYEFWSKFYQEMFNKNFYRVNDTFKYFKEMLDSGKYSPYEIATNVMKCIQVIPYERPKNLAKKDTGSNILDFFSPNELAEYGKGDCDTKSLFMIILLKRLGFDAIMYHSAHYGHAMVGININASGTYKTYNNKKYYFIESTYPGWKIGDIPPEMKNTEKWRIMPIK